MIALHRLAQPAVLAENGERWLERFLAQREKNPGQRPDSRQYGHWEIRNALRGMSFRKCFYCERKLSEYEDEIDHFIEVVESPEQAFRWENLYLSCRDCNRHKTPNSRIPVSDCLNPCDKSTDPSEHLTFSEEFIRPRQDSPIGARTIQKYRLDRDQLNYLRTKQLQQFERFIRIMYSACNREGRSLNEAEREAIVSFGHGDREYSLMFRSYLTAVRLP